MLNVEDFLCSEEYTTYKIGEDWGMVYYCFTHINYSWVN
jgi:hypothetical protein